MLPLANHSTKLLKFLPYILILLLATSYSYSDQTIDSLKRSLNYQLPDSTRAATLLKISDRIAYLNPDESIDHSEKALKIASSLQDTALLIHSFYSIAFAKEFKGNIEEAYTYYSKSLAYSKASNSTIGALLSYSALGIIHKNWGDYKTALELYEQGLDLQEKTKDTSMLGAFYLNIANIYFNLGRYGPALIYNKLALENGKKIKNKYNVMSALNNLGNIYHTEKKYDLALSYFNEALIKIEELKAHGKNKILNNIGLAYKAKGDFAKAEKYFFETIEITKETKDSAGIAIAYNNLAELYLAQENYTKAEKYAFEALIYPQRIKSKVLLKEMYLTIHSLYSKKSNYHEALKYYKLYDEMKDSLTNEAVTNKIAEVSAKFRIKSIENENALLRNEKDIKDLTLQKERTFNYFLMAASLFSVVLIFVLINRAKIRKKTNQLLEGKNLELKDTNLKLQDSEKELKQLNRDKDKFLSIIAHDLKNPISILISLSEYLSNRITIISTETIKEFSSDIHESALRINSLLENLLQWSRSQSGKIPYSPELIDLSYLVDNSLSILKLNAEKKKISIISEINNVIYINVDINMISTVIRNLVSNSIKFTPNGGKITVSAEQNDSLVEVTIQDTGIGLSEEDQQKLFRIDTHHTTIGTSEEKGTGLGLLLCKEFVEKHGGTIRVNSKLGIGSSFIFTISK